MSNTAFEAWWTPHYADQPEVTKRIALAAFEAGLTAADQMHHSITDFLEIDRPVERGKKHAAA